MIKIILCFFQIIAFISSNKLNITFIDNFFEKLSYISVNLSSFLVIHDNNEIINSKKYCRKYNESLSICLECENDYVLLNGECVCYDKNCKKCKSSLYGACTECYPGFALSSENTCRCNIPHCLLCDDYTCNVCEKGYSLSESGTSCIFNYTMKNIGFCDDINCDICTSDIDGACIKCKDGFNLENGTCIENPSLGKFFKGNILCPENYISAGKGCNKMCLGANCSNISVHYMTCENNCVYCKEGILYEQLNCKMDNFCYDNKCTKCRTNEEGMCDKCEIGYKLLYGKCENKCNDPNCLNCDYTLNGSCNWCKKGYVLIEGNCYLKEEGYSKIYVYNLYEEVIKNYSKSFNITYLGKGEFYAYYENENLKINQSELIMEFHQKKFNEICSIENCSCCLLNNPKYCTVCNDDYTEVNGKCIKCKISNCSICLTENVCNRCQEDYVLINNQCIKNYGTTPFCLKYSNEQCTQCEDNYNLLSGQCNLNSIYTQNTQYDKLSCTDDSIRKEVCLQKYYYKNNNCSTCFDSKCLFCYEGIGCIICEKGYNLIDGRCLKTTEFNETVDYCVSYDYDGKCIECDSFCILREDECNCKIVSDIIIYLLIAVLAIIIAAIILIIFKQRLSVSKIEQLNENNMKLIEDNKITQQEMAFLQESDKKLEKCSYCKIETALFKLTCGCLLCKEDFKDTMEKLNSSDGSENINMNINNIGNNTLNNNSIKNNNNNNIKNNNKIFDREKYNWKEKNISDNLLSSSCNFKIKRGKCPSCLKEFYDYKQIAQQCEICFETTCKIFHFKCGCALSVCKFCFNKIIVSKKCPGCRKNILIKN